MDRLVEAIPFTLGYEDSKAIEKAMKNGGVSA